MALAVAHSHPPFLLISALECSITKRFAVILFLLPRPATINTSLLSCSSTHMPAHQHRHPAPTLHPSLLILGRHLHVLIAHCVAISMSRSTQPNIFETRNPQTTDVLCRIQLTLSACVAICPSAIGVRLNFVRKRSALSFMCGAFLLFLNCRHKSVCFLCLQDKGMFLALNMITCVFLPQNRKSVTLCHC
jgi:hypothetical protein